MWTQLERARAKPCLLTGLSGIPLESRLAAMFGCSAKTGQDRENTPPVNRVFESTLGSDRSEGPPFQQSLAFLPASDAEPIFRSAQTLPFQARLPFVAISPDPAGTEPQLLRDAKTLAFRSRGSGQRERARVVRAFRAGSPRTENSEVFTGR